MSSVQGEEEFHPFCKNRILKTPPRVGFDVNNPEHRKEYKKFIETGKFDIRFQVEHPYTSIPTMAMAKLAEFAVANLE